MENWKPESIGGGILVVIISLIVDMKLRGSSIYLSRLFERKNGSGRQ